MSARTQRDGSARTLRCDGMGSTAATVRRARACSCKTLSGVFTAALFTTDESKSRSSRHGAAGGVSNCRGSGRCGATGLIPGPAKRVKGSGIVAAVAHVRAVAQIQSLAGEPPHAIGVEIKRKKIILIEKSKSNRIVYQLMNVYLNRA